MQQASENGEPVVREWSSSEIHKRVITPTSTEEKLSLYAAWAKEYDTDVSGMGYEAPAQTARRLFPYIKATPPPAAGTKLRLLDAGCGTGRCMDTIKEFPEDPARPMHFIGLDYSREMLDVARERGYDELLEVDLSKPFEMEGGKVDFILAAGLFLEGHCGPEVMPNLFEHLKEGGLAVISVRNVSYVAAEKQYMEWIEKSELDVVQNNVGTYMKDTVEANYIVLRKRI